MTLVETHPNESTAEFRAAIDALLQSISPDRPNWWHPYEVRGTYICRGIRFRQFHCIAGSVEAWLWTLANKGAPRRLILLSDQSSTVFGPVRMYERGEQIVIHADEVQPAPSNV